MCAQPAIRQLQELADPRSYDYFIAEEFERRYFMPVDHTKKEFLERFSKIPKSFDEWIPKILERLSTRISSANEFKFALTILNKVKDECCSGSVVSRLPEIDIFPPYNCKKIRMDILIGKLFRYEDLTHVGHDPSDYKHTCDSSICINPWHLQFTELSKEDHALETEKIQKLREEYGMLNKKFLSTLGKNLELCKELKNQRKLYQVRLDQPRGLLELTGQVLHLKEQNSTLISNIEKSESKCRAKDGEVNLMQHKICKLVTESKQKDAEIADLNEKYLTACREAYIKELDALTGIEFIRENHKVYKQYNQ